MIVKLGVVPIEGFFFSRWFGETAGIICGPLDGLRSCGAPLIVFVCIYWKSSIERYLSQFPREQLFQPIWTDLIIPIPAWPIWGCIAVLLVRDSWDVNHIWVSNSWEIWEASLLGSHWCLYITILGGKSWFIVCTLWVIMHWVSLLIFVVCTVNFLPKATVSLSQPLKACGSFTLFINVSLTCTTTIW